MKTFRTALFQIVLLILCSTCFAFGASSGHGQENPSPAIERLLSQLKLDAKFRNGASGQAYLDVSILNTGDQEIALEALSFKRAGIDLMIKGSDKRAWPRAVSVILEQPDVFKATVDAVPVDLSQLAVLQLPARSLLKITFEWDKLLVSLRPQIERLGKLQPDWEKSIIKAKISFHELVDVPQSSGKRRHGGIASPWLEFGME